MSALYTVGYQSGIILEALAAKVLAVDATLVDTRLAPYARGRPEWNVRQLNDRLGDRYLCIRAFGNRNHKRDDPIVLVDPAADW